MQPTIPILPEQASTVAPQVDHLYFLLIAVSAFFAVLVTLMVVVFAIKYRRRHDDEVGEPIHGSLGLELLWTGIPFVIAMVMFVWGASVYFAIARMPEETLDIYAVGKQWMWKFQHREGQREINELHVPVGRPVKLMMGSEDVIHSYYIPDFRVKADVIPGRYNSMWFTATKPGRYRLFCAEYCGTKHSGMIGWITAMEPAEFQAWLGGGACSEPSSRPCCSRTAWASEHCAPKRACSASMSAWGTSRSWIWGNRWAAEAGAFMAGVSGEQWEE